MNLLISNRHIEQEKALVKDPLEHEWGTEDWGAMCNILIPGIGEISFTGKEAQIVKICMKD